MKSELIEYFRFGDTETGILAPGNHYILAQRDLPVLNVEVKQRQINLMAKLKETLRYDEPILTDKKNKAIQEISDFIKTIMVDLERLSSVDSYQLDVVLNAAELGLLPFELLLDKEGNPYFAVEEKQWVLTRRIRQNSFEKPFVWPVRPRVLFAYSHGGGRAVPYKDHLYQLDKALEKWGGIENKDVFTLLDNASFDEIESELKKADEKSYYTHVHILAHGKKIGEEIDEIEYGIALGKDDTEVAKTESVKELFEALVQKPLLVSYMICDGANFSNPLTPDKNPVLVTHKAGVPMVFGSQFPLSMDGSTVVTKNLFRSLFNGDDIRTILHSMRVELYKRGQEYHDWISLVSYLRLPEGYEDFLFKTALEYQMQDLRHIKSETDKFVGKKNIGDDFLNRMAELKACVRFLEGRLKELQSNKKYEDELLETLGLLGSSYKRIAELYFIKNKVDGALTEQQATEQKESLDKSINYYKNASEKNLNHHWTLVQFISLDTVTGKKMSDSDAWFAARKAVNISLGKSPNSWAYGSLIELLLLDPNPGADYKERINNAVNQLVKMSTQEKNDFPMESSWYQINRYREWWIKENGFEISEKLLARDNELLDNILKALKTGLENFKKNKES